MNGKGSVYNARNVEIFIVLVFELIFIGLYIQSILIGDMTRSLWPLIAIVLTLVPFAFEWKDKVSLPFGLKMMIPFALFLHVAGGIMRWYWEVPLFDKFAHVVSAIALGLILFTMYQYLDYLEYAKKKPFFKKRIRIFKTQEEDVLAGILVILVIEVLVHGKQGYSRYNMGELVKQWHFPVQPHKCSGNMEEQGKRDHHFQSER